MVFPALVSSKIMGMFYSPHRSFGPLDDWSFVSSNLRRFLKGWGWNRAADSRKVKDRLLSCIKSLDDTADAVSLDEAGWAHHYEFESALFDLHRWDEVYWQ